MLIGSNPDHRIAKCHIHKALRGEKFSWYGHGTASNDRPDQFEKLEFPPEGVPGIKMLWSDNPAFSTSLNGGNEYYDALRSDNLECYVVQAPWFEDDARFADIVLPITTKFESSDFGTDADSGQWNSVIYEEQAIEHVGEARTDWEAVVKLPAHSKCTAGATRTFGSDSPRARAPRTRSAKAMRRAASPRRSATGRRSKSASTSLFRRLRIGKG